MDGYKLGGKLAEGRFGVVFLASSIETGEKVAIKKIRARRPIPGLNMDPWSKSAEREVEILSQVRHHHIVRLLDHDASQSTGTFVLVYELLALDLEALLERHKPLEEGQAKIVMQMLFTGLAYLHSLEVMHRDIKPSNLLLEAVTGLLKIADFGSARFSPGAAAMPLLSGAVSSPSGYSALCRDSAELDMAETEQGLTREVCTRWYKSPEMLFGSIDYDLAVDLWATGCVLAVLLSPTATPLFEGQSDIDQLCCIFRIRGTPREDDWPEVSTLPDFAKIEFTACEPQPFVFHSDGGRSLEAEELVEGLLRLNPAKRVTAAEALVCNFFHRSPAMAEARSLASLLDEPGDLNRRANNDDFGSDGSDFASPDWEFEAIPIETTSCGLWDGAVAAGTQSDDSLPCLDVESPPRRSTPPPPAPVRHSTPPPPQSGMHRFKPGVL